MHASNHSPLSRKPSPQAPSSVFRFRQEPAGIKPQRVRPFTETPVELRPRQRIGRLLRGMVNFLLLALLSVALLALIAAFAYQMVYHPDVLSAGAFHLVQSVRGFFVTLTSMLLE